MINEDPRFNRALSFIFLQKIAIDIVPTTADEWPISVNDDSECILLQQEINDLDWKLQWFSAWNHRHFQQKSNIRKAALPALEIIGKPKMAFNGDRRATDEFQWSTTLPLRQISDWGVTADRKHLVNWPAAAWVSWPYSQCIIQLHGSADHTVSASYSRMGQLTIQSVHHTAAWVSWPYSQCIIQLHGSADHTVSASDSWLGQLTTQSVHHTAAWVSWPYSQCIIQLHGSADHTVSASYSCTGQLTIQSVGQTVGWVSSLNIVSASGYELRTSIVKINVSIALVVSI